MAVDVSGDGYLAGELPTGITTVDGAPVQADVRVFYEVPGTGDWQLVEKVTADTDGTWQVLNVSLAYTFNVVGEYPDYYGVVAYNVEPTDMLNVTYSGSSTGKYPDFNTIDTTLEVVGGLPPYTASATTALPTGITPSVVAHQLVFSGTTTDQGVFNSVVRVTADNGPYVDVPVYTFVGLNPVTNVEGSYDGTDLTITWDTDNTFEDGFNIYRDTVPLAPLGLPAPIATLGPGETSYVDDSGLTDDTLYYYMIGTEFDGLHALTSNVGLTTAPNDPYYADVILLMHMNGTSGATTYTDEKGHTFVHHSTAPTISTVGATAEFHESLYFNYNSGIYSAASSDWALGTGDFTIECFVTRATGSPSDFAIVGNFATGGADGWILQYYSGGLRFSYGNGGLIKTSSMTVTDDVRMHIAVRRLGGQLSFWKDGVQFGGDTADSTDLSATHRIVVGNLEFGGSLFYPWYGYIDELRITKGVGRTITVPTVEYPNA